MEPGQITISLYENSIPDFVEAELDALYEHVYSSLAQFSIYGCLHAGTHTYVAQQNGKTSAVLLFRCDRNKVRVLNEQISIEAEEVEQFARYVFDAFPAIDVIRFHAAQTELLRFMFPYQRFYRTEDIVLSLPRTIDEYTTSLGKATRKNIKYYSNRLKRNYPTLGYAVYQNEEINAQHVRDIVAMNRARMSGKNKVSEMDDTETDRLIALAKQNGMVCVMMIDGHVIAGTVCSRVGANYFMHMMAHDPAYDDARVGTLCCYLTISDSIARGGKKFHFMWGRFDYKYMLLGVQRNYDEIFIYRSRMHLALNAGTALPMAFHGRLRMLKFWLLELADRKDESNGATRFAFRFLNMLRNFKRAGFGLRLHRS